ncbi:peptidase S10, serine carboxypeptidase, Alpha/Beta hydrolase fold protein [Artemisia annua]|uniref:Carboxypeptidase n=1 Tax=Artemisia annua TaxID=35608 RepID=A0A2U1PCP3_ARTAN|nr:peptidase S10, serine carboxypeptidase, Alpha/Beta hydrolase fold protein [Artemisia annua]
MDSWSLGTILVSWLCLLQWCNGELIESLPGQPSDYVVTQYSGYIVTNEKHGRSLFYYFIEAASANHTSLPVTMWLNGGPGCSSLGFGAFMENGPFQVGEDGLLVLNHHSWNLESNMLYVESPIGVGFSYSNTDEDYIDWNDTKTANDNLVFITKWLEEFPLYKDAPFFLVGESYAGHYIPQLAELILKYNKDPNATQINLKAIAIGNPLLDIDISVLAGDYLWAHGAISDKTLMLEKTVCNDSTFLREYAKSGWSQGCNDVFNRVQDEVSLDVPFDDMLLPKCMSTPSSQQFKSQGLHAKAHASIDRIRALGDPCLQSRIFTYLNRRDVQIALHANTTDLPYRWDFCQGPLVYQEQNLEIDVIPLISDLIKAGLPIWLYSGDQDSKIPLTQTRIIANNIADDLKLTTLTDYRTWHNGKQVGGWSQSFGGLKDGKNVTYLTYATVRGAAHEVPFTSPSQALTLFRCFLNGSPLPRPKS